MAPTTALTEPFEEFVPLWQELRSESREGAVVIVVEGERDRRSLRRLGITGPIALVHQGHSLAASAQALAKDGRRIILLTDWDLEGGHLAQRLREFLEAGDQPFDLDYRRRLGRILRGEIVHVEGLAGWARRCAERLGAPLDHFLPNPDG